MRKAVLLLTMVAGISLVLWAGWHNLRERRRAMWLQEQARVDLVPGGGGPAAKDSGDGGSLAQEGASLRGKPAPAFTLDNLAGEKVSLSDFKGRPLVVNFWGTYCDPCKIEMPWLEEFQKKYAADGLEVVGVTYDAEVGKETIGKDVRKLGVSYPILLSTPEVEKTYLSDSEVLPMTFYVDKAGEVVDVSAGLGSKDELEAMVKETIAGEAK
jgi:thiol-disulfide isomerase/thioredoxin